MYLDATIHAAAYPPIDACIEKLVSDIQDEDEREVDRMMYKRHASAVLEQDHDYFRAKLYNLVELSNWKLKLKDC